MAHFRGKNICFQRKDLPTSEYHQIVYSKQEKCGYILSYKEREKIYNNVLKKHGLID